MTVSIKSYVVTLAVSVSAVAVACIMLKRRKARKCKKKRVWNTPKPLDDFPMLKPGNGTPLFHGLRVVELSTMVAAPCAARMMSDLGAEVVKIEDPKGDYWRNFFLDFESERDFGSSWEVINLGKRSVVLDLKRNEALQKLMELLKQADVFITNVRLEGMKRLGLDYETIHKIFPSLVYANLTAWGADGPDKDLPGYDVACFWASTGLAASIHPEGSYQVLPPACGDATAGANMLAGISVALLHRMHTGIGLLVDTALLRIGYWCMAPLILPHLKPDYKTPPSVFESRPKIEHAPNYTRPFNTRMLWNSYETREKEHIFLLHQDSPKSLEEKLARRLGIIISSEVSQVDIVKAVQAKIKQMTLAEIQGGILKELEIHNIKMNSLREAVLEPDYLFDEKHANCFDHVDEIKDVARWPRVPIDFSCSSNHRPRGRGPMLGEHTSAFIQRGFSKVSPEADIRNISAKSTSKEISSGLLSRVTVVELSDIGACVPASCAQLVDYGATVIKVEPPGGDFWRNSDPLLFNHFNRGKKSVVIPFTKVELQEKLMRLLQQAQVFVTSLPLDKLKSLGLDYDSLKRRFSSLIYVIVTPWGLNGPHINRGDLGAFWSHSGIASLLAGAPPAPPPPQPYQLGELMASIYTFTGISTALFHLERTGEGQQVHVNLLHVGTFINGQLFTFMQKDPLKMHILQQAPEKVHDYWPVPPGNCFRTKDGFWVQLLGIELPKHLVPTIKALNVQWKVFSRVILTLIFHVLLSRKPKILKFLPVFANLNQGIEEGMSRLTWEEFKELAAKKNIWYCPVLPPSQAAEYRQAHFTGIFRNCDIPSSAIINSPVYFRSTGNVALKLLSPTLMPVQLSGSASSETGATTAMAPKLGEHNSELFPKRLEEA